MEALETYTDEATGLIGEVSYDEFSADFNPRENYDNAWTILTAHRNRIAIDEELPNECWADCPDCEPEDSDCDNPECYFGQIDNLELWLRQDYDAYLIVPVYAYEHGLIQYQASTGGNPYSCEWDSGQIGVAVMDRKTLEHEWPEQTTIEGETFDRVQMALKCLDGELIDYTDWANGHVYQWTVEDANGEILESCGGIFGYDDAETMCQEHLSYWAEETENKRKAEAAERRYWAERDVITVG